MSEVHESAAESSDTTGTTASPEGHADPGVTSERGRPGPELVVATEPESKLAEQFRRLRNSIQALNPDGASRVVLLTSAVAGEGKSVSTLNLAMALVELPNQRVCVVDADRQDPSVERYLGLSREPGMGEVLAGGLALDDAVRHTSHPRLDILGAGSDSFGQALNVDRMRALVNNLKRRYDYVLIDAPAVLASNQPSLLCSVADGILLVVRMGSTPKLQVEEAFSMLESLGGNVLGTCATGLEE